MPRSLHRYGKMMLKSCMFPLASLSTAVQAQPPIYDVYAGPGYYCGSGFLVTLNRGDEVRSRSTAIDDVLIKLTLGGRKITAFSESSSIRMPVRAVIKIPGGELRQIDKSWNYSYDQPRPSYVIENGMPFALRILSSDFRGYSRDQWFFERVKFIRNAEKRAQCLQYKQQLGENRE